MVTATIRPNADLSNNGFVTSGPATLWECLDDDVIQPTNANSGGDGASIVGNADGEFCEVGFGTLPVQEVTALTLWVFAFVQDDALANPNITANLMNGAVELGQTTFLEAAEHWQSVDLPSVSLTQAELDGISVLFQSGGAGTSQRRVFATYLDVTFVPPGGGRTLLFVG